MKIDDIEVYNRSYKLALEMHKFSNSLPSYLKYDLADQIRRSSRSIPSNICEGLMRNKSSKDKINFLKNSLGSCDEMQFNLKFVKDILLIREEEYNYFKYEYDIVGKQLVKFIKYLRNQKPVY